MYRNRKLPYLFMLPAILTILFLNLIPFIFSIGISLTDWNGISPTMNFIGLRNYLDIFTDFQMHGVLLNNGIYFLFLVFVQNAIGLVIALILNGKFRGRNFFRATVFFPTLVSSVAVGFIWALIYNPLSGVLTTITRTLGLPSLVWLGDPNYTIYAIITTSIWQWVGWNVVIYFAGLQSIPEELNEAASIDGAGALQRAINITFPMLAPAITINIVMSSIGALRFFDLPFVMTRGGPGRTTSTIAIEIYNSSFLLNRMGFGIALSLVLFLLILIVSVVQTTFLRKREERMD